MFMMNLRNIKWKNKVLLDFLACALIIVSHFTNYIIYTEYTRVFPDIVFAVIILCGVSAVLTALLQIPSSILRVSLFAFLITIVFSDAVFEYGTADTSVRFYVMSATFFVAVALVFLLREHTSKVLVGAFLAMFCSTLLIGNFNVSGQAEVDANSSKTSSPILVHLVLDEHMGLAGMTSALPGGERIREELSDFYTRAGFRLFGHAYSQYFKTAASLASAMNFNRDGRPYEYLTKKRYGFSLDKNTYLQRITNPSLGANIYQSSYFDFCQEKSIKINKCKIYKPDNIDEKGLRSFSLFNRVSLILRMYYSSFSIVKLAKLLEIKARAWALREGQSLPPLGLWHGRVGPLAVGPTLDHLANDLSHASGGSVYFAHLLIPHYPYVYSPSCALRSPVSDWLLRQRADGANTAESRERRYADYFDQVRCTLQKIEALFDVMRRNGTYESAVIVIHGDHGARINLIEPSAAAAAKMTADDFIDSFSTLFAIKAPGVLPGVDRRMLPLVNLLEYAVARDERLLSEAAIPSVYLAEDDAQFKNMPLPGFTP